MFEPFLKFYITTSLFSTLPNIPWFNLFFIETVIMLFYHFTFSLMGLWAEVCNSKQ